MPAISSPVRLSIALALLAALAVIVAVLAAHGVHAHTAAIMLDGRPNIMLD